MSLKNQLAVGLDKGFVTAKRTSKKTRPSRRRGKQNAAVGTVRQIVREVVGLTPYVIFFCFAVSRISLHTYSHMYKYRLEKRLVDIYKIGIGNPDKRVYKISKKRVRFRIAAFIFSSLSSTLTFLSKNSSELTSVLLRSERELSRSTRICVLPLLQRIKKFFRFVSAGDTKRGIGSETFVYERRFTSPFVYVCEFLCPLNVFYVSFVLK